MFKNIIYNATNVNNLFNSPYFTISIVCIKFEASLKGSEIYQIILQKV